MQGCTHFCCAIATRADTVAQARHANLPDKRPRPPGEEALYKYPTRRVGYRAATGRWCGNPHNQGVLPVRPPALHPFRTPPFPPYRPRRPPIPSPGPAPSLP